MRQKNPLKVGENTLLLPVLSNNYAEMASRKRIRELISQVLSKRHSLIYSEFFSL